MSVTKNVLNTLRTLNHVKSAARYLSISSALKINEEITNRNPRNLEQMLLEQKPNGYWLDIPSRKYWNKVSLDITMYYVYGKVTHHTGRVVVSASSSEPALKRRLSSTKDKNAVEIVARLLAKRCFQTGISYIHHEILPGEDRSEKFDIFLKTLESEGLRLTEPEHIRRRWRNDV